MDVFFELKKRMCSYSKIKDEKVITDHILAKGMNQIQLRDYLMEISTILEADEKEEIYITVINAGFGNKNPAIVGLMLKDNILYIAAYAKEGLINQRTAEKVVKKISALVN